MDRRKSLVLIVLLLIFCVIISIEAVSEFRHLIDLTVSKLHRLKELHCCHSIQDPQSEMNAMIEQFRAMCDPTKLDPNALFESINGMMSPLFSLPESLMVS